MNRTIFAALLATMLVACNAKNSPNYTLIDSDRVIREAEAAITKVSKVGYEWRDTSGILAQAKAAHKKNDFNTAVALAGKAKRQAENALEQYHMEMKVFN